MFKFVVFVLLLVRGLESRVIGEFPLTGDGLEIDFEVKNKDTAIMKMQINVNDHDKTVRLIRSQPPISVGSATGNAGGNATVLPTIDNRTSINGGSGCPSGYTKKGGFCFPDDDY